MGSKGDAVGGKMTAETKKGILPCSRLLMLVTVPSTA